MELSELFEIGDYVQITKRDGERVKGTIIRMSAGHLVIKDNRGLKSIFNAELIESISQVEQPEYSNTEVVPPKRPDVRPDVIPPENTRFTWQDSEMLSMQKSNLSREYQMLSFEASKLDTSAEVTMETIRKHKFPNSVLQSRFQSIYSSIEYAIKKDRTSLDDKITAGIQKARTLFQEFQDDNILRFSAFFTTLYSPKKKSETSHFCDAVNYLLKIGQQKVAISFLLSNGHLPDCLGLWQQFINEPKYLVATFQKKFIRNANNSQLLLNYVHEVQRSAIHSTESKVLLLYSLLSVIDKAKCNSVLLHNDYASLLVQIIEMISTSLESYSDKGVVVGIRGSGGTLLTQELAIIPYEYYQSFSLGDILNFWWDGENNKASITGLDTKETAGRHNLRKVYNLLCEQTFCNQELSDIKDRLRIILFHSQSPLVPTGASQFPSKMNIQALIQRQTSAKTAEEVGLVIRETKEFLKRNPNNKTAVSILIELLMRKVDPHYQDAINVFYQYNYLFENSLEYKIKNYRKIFDAFFAIEDYGTAKEVLLFVVNNSQSPPVDYYIKIAQCYLQMQDNKSALTWCKKAESNKNSNVPSVQAPLRTCKFAAYIGLEKLDDAKRELEIYEKLTTRTDKIEEMRSILEGLRSGQNTIEDFESLLDEIILIPTGDDQFLLSELYTPYLKFQLDNCDYSCIRDRVQDEQTRKWTWNPSSVQNAESIFNEIKSKAGYRYRDSNDIRIGVIDEVVDKYLNMSKIAEVCLKKAEKGEWELSLPETANWKSLFVLTSARYMWLLYKKYSVRERVNPDSCAFYLKECIGLYMKDHDNARTKGDYYDALSTYLMIVSAFNGDKVDVFKDLRTKDIRQLSNIRDNSSIAHAQDTLIKNLSAAFSYNPGGVLKGLASIVSQFPSFQSTAISLLVESSVDEKALNYLAKRFPSVFQDSDDGLSLDNLIYKYSEALTKNCNVISTAISEIEKEILKGKISSIDTNSESIVANSNCFEDTYLLKEDIFRCHSFSQLIFSKSSDSYYRLATENVYDACNGLYTSINSACIIRIQDYHENPTEFSFRFLERIYAELAEVALKIRDEVAERSLPVLSISDDYVDEGYTPINDTVNLMLRVANGRSGENCTTATNICMDVKPGEGDEEKCNISIKHYENVIPQLQRGEETPIEIAVSLTGEGNKPDSMIMISFTITYQTINGKIYSINHDQVVYIKGLEFERIPNPYDLNPLAPENMNKKMFVGRDNDIDNLSNEIIHSNRGKTVIIYGQFRSGKTSLGKFLAAKIQERDNSFMVVDSGTVMSDSSISDIINEIVYSIIEGIKTKLGFIPVVLLEYVETDATEKNYIRYFTKFAKSLKVVLEKQMSNMRILILLDELGRFLEHNEASAFTELWKAIMALGAFDAILIGHDSITRVIQANNNAFGVMTLFHISYLAYEPSVRLITDPTAMTVNGEKHSRFIGKSIDYIWNQSGGNVFYLQHICKASVEFMNDWHRNVLNETYVQQAIKEYLNKKTPDDITLIGHSLFQSSDGWDGITDRDNKIVLDAITKTNHLKFGSNTESIVGYINESYQELALSSEQIQRVLFSLLSRKVVLKDDRGCFSIVAKFYSDYLNEYIIRPILPDR